MSDRDSYYKSTPGAWLRLLGFVIAAALLISWLGGCIDFDDDEDGPYIDPDSRTCCRSIVEPDGGVDAGDDAGAE